MLYFVKYWIKIVRFIFYSVIGLQEVSDILKGGSDSTQFVPCVKDSRVILVIMLVILILLLTVACEPLPPKAEFGVLPENGQAPLEVHFIDLSMGEVDNYQWDFNNDGYIDSIEPNPWHTYTEPGSYSVSLTVSGIGGSDIEVKIDYLEVTSVSR